jgi:hypothetical protein
MIDGRRSPSVVKETVERVSDRPHFNGEVAPESVTTDDIDDAIASLQRALSHQRGKEANSIQET